MMEKQPLSFFDKINNWARSSVSLKLISIGILILILLIPSSMLSSLIYERQSVRDSAIDEVSSKWGNSQVIGGPVISVPYRTVTTDVNGKSIYGISYAHFLPDLIDISGTVNPEKRYRGIYVVVLYNTVLKVSGKFPVIDFENLGIAKSSFMLDDAVLSIGLSDMKGIRDEINIRMNDTSYSCNPGIVTSDIFSSGISIPIDLTAQKGFDFSFDMNINGSTHLGFLPFGKETNVSLTSSWGHPSFEGSFLPDERAVTDSGFSATWKVLQLNRNYPQSGLGAFIGNNGGLEQITNNDLPDYSAASEFGVKLLLPIDEYQKTMRSAKYNVMFIFLTFLAFFFVEVMNKKRIHPIQYLLVGFAICLFYVLLLSLSEHINFDKAYLAGCVAVLTLIMFYCKSVFKNNMLTALITGILAVLYGFFYSLLQLEDYALLMGSVGLLLILAVIMYLTRNIDWYNTEKSE
jgi:inner membrane protein